MFERKLSIAKRKVVYCRPQDRVPVVADIMQRNNIGSIVVGSPEDVQGIITVGDLLRLVVKHDKVSGIKASEVMKSPVVSLDEGSSIDEMVRSFKDNKVTRLLIMDKQGRPTGIVRDLAVYQYLSFSRIESEAEGRATAAYGRY